MGSNPAEPTNYRSSYTTASKEILAKNPEGYAVNDPNKKIAMVMLRAKPMDLLS
jgi:hypothetical protein